MDLAYRDIGELIARVRARWRRLTVLKAVAVAALAAAAVLLVALAVARLTGRSPGALAATGVAAVITSLAVVFRALWPARRTPTDVQVARFIEEREPSLDDRLVSAVDVASRPIASPLAGAMLGDAGRRASRVDPAAIVEGAVLRRAALRASLAALALVAVGFAGRGVARRSYDALAFTLFPERIQLNVTPGDARVQAGSALTIEARLAGNTAPVAAQLQRADGDGWVTFDMPADERGAFRARFASLTDSFTYRVVAGALTSPVFEVAVVRPPRVTRIDVEYRYPDALHLPPRVEEDSGDIYAPAGTDVRLRIHTDREASSGQMSLGDGRAVALTAGGGLTLAANLTIERDDSYRVRIADREGMSNPGETEYFIRMLDDRPPEVRVLRPARDRSVTRLEEVDIQAEAQDDFGVESLDLVYAVRGGAEKVVPLAIPRRATAVTGAHTLFLEELDVKPGDFISYYVRARDVARGRQSSEARSDLFFLEVKPFEQEFTLAQSQAQGGGSGNPQLDDLVNAQKEIIVATWKLDRRAAANGAKSDDDIRAVGRAEAELKTRAEQTASAFRESTMRDPRRRQPAPGAPRAGQTLPEEDAMTAAVKALEKAIASLQALKTKAAMPPELEALNHLLAAQADVKEKQITRQTGTGAAGQNRATQDLSSLFDKELARQQETNYETPSTSEQKDEDSPESQIDKIRELAQRQDELLRKQQELARTRQQMTAEEVKRQLETLSREQLALRQQAEDLARRLSAQGSPSADSQQARNGQQPPPGGQPNQGQQGGQQSQSPQGQGQQSQGGQQGQASSSKPGQSGRQAQSGERRSGDQAGAQGGDAGSRMREVSEEMRNAASELRREDPNGASARGSRALDALRQVERQLQAGVPNEQRRALGDMQLEARQLADAQRQLSQALQRLAQQGGEPGSNRAGETGQAAQPGQSDRSAQSGQSGRTPQSGPAGVPAQGEQDALRRLAGEEQRLAERTEQLRENLERQANASSPRGGARGGGDQAADAQRAAGEAARELERQRVAERMQQSADALQAAAGGQAPAGGKGQAPDRSARQAAQAAAGAQEEVARALDRVADRIAAGNAPQDDESKKLSAQMARAQELRDRLAETGRQLERLGQTRGSQGQPGGSQPDASGQGARSGSSGQPSASPDAPSGREPGAGSGGDVSRLRDEYARELKEAKDLLDQMRRDDRSSGQGGAGFTFEDQGMVLSAPGTEAFKQDFAKWEELRRQATQALERAESDLSQQLQSRAAKDRLAAGVDDRPPAAYRAQVDSYFKALAGKKSK